MQRKELQKRSDEELVAIFQRDPGAPEGREAVACLLERHVDGLHRWCSRFVTDPERVRDMVQETMLAVLKGLPGFQRQAKFRSWLFTIARNRSLNSQRSRRLLFVESDELDLHPSAEPDPSIAAEWAIEKEKLRQIFQDELTPLERRAMWLRCVDGVSVDEITRLLGIEQASGARGMLQAARRKLRAAMPRDSEEWRDA